MAKVPKQGPSFADFNAEDSPMLDPIENEEVETQEEEEEEEEEVVPKKKAVVVAKTKTKDPDPVPPVTKKKEATPTPPIEEEEQEEEEEEVDPNEEEETEVPDSQKFFEEVEKITGNTIEVDYGKIDPLSPQGVALREKAIREDALEIFLGEIEDKFPAAYNALQYAYKGGDISELFTHTTGRDYTKVEIKDEDEDLAKDILKEYYRGKNIKDEARLARLIAADEDSEGGVVKEARSALAEMKEEQVGKQSKLLAEQQQKDEERKKRDRILISSIDENLEKRDLGDFKIADRAEAVAFREFLMNSVRRTPDGKYEFATIIEPTNLNKLLQYQYFQYKNGDLSKVIRQTAKTENVKNLKLRLQGEQQKMKKQKDPNLGLKGSMKDFLI